MLKNAIAVVSPPSDFPKSLGTSSDCENIFARCEEGFVKSLSGDVDNLVFDDVSCNVPSVLCQINTDKIFCLRAEGLDVELIVLFGLR